MPAAPGPLECPRSDSATLERLHDAGIWTLGDLVAVGVHAIPGIGPARSATLGAWALGRRFVP